jgi:hypothetical protein
MNQGPASPTPAPESRRSFLKKTAVATAAVALVRFAAGTTDTTDAEPGGAAAGAPAAPSGPWYRRARRWGQTNITEIDPMRYDMAWWRQQWQRTRVQGVIINAGGIVAYYPTQVPMHRRAQFLGNRDLFGEVCAAAHADGLVVFARMDSSGAHEELYRAHSDWFAVDANGKPYRARDLYVSCVNGPYYEEHLLAILRELVARYHPEGFTDNSWSGLGRGSICYCENCRKKFHERAGRDLPRQKDWNDPTYRDWIRWSYACRLEVWDRNNRVTREAGGPECLWVGMNGGDVAGQAEQFRDCKEICARAEIIMLDDQRRQNATGFARNGEVGKLVHGLLGWDKLAPESMAMYQTTAPTFRLSSKPEPESRLWMVEGFAAGIQPWWHHVGAYDEDRRMYRTPVALCQWHAANEEFLFNRRPVATVGVAWSQTNTDFFGRDDAELNVELPWNGLRQALVRGRIPYLPVHLDHLDRDAAQFRLLILPNLAAMSDAQVASVRRFVEGGGGLLATGQSSLCNEWGDGRSDFALADLFGAHLPENHGMRNETTRHRWAAESAHTYLRLTPELRARGDVPHAPDEPPATGERHPVLRGFDATDILPFGGTLEALRIDASAQVLATFIPPFPVSPPEMSWMRTPKTDIAGLVVSERTKGARVAYLAADLDRRFGRDNLPDHGDLLANLVRWTARDDVPLRVEGPGLVDCHMYRQSGRAILHLVNLTNAGTWRAPVDELIPVGPLRVAVRLPDGVPGRRLRLLVSGGTTSPATADGWATFELRSLLDHEVAVIE